jgi:hypothetical protein
MWTARSGSARNPPLIPATARSKAAESAPPLNATTRPPASAGMQDSRTAYKDAAEKLMGF